MQRPTRCLSILFVLLIGFLSFTFLGRQPAQAAASATIGLSPKSGVFGKQFTISVVVNGNGQQFNAAQATVTIPSNLSIQDLVTGDCNFSFLQTPTITNPSFAGIHLGGSLQSCTVYTLTLAPVTKGNATITLSQGSVRRFGDAANILAGMDKGTYTLTNVVKVTPQPTIAPSQGNLYSVLLTLQTTEQKPVQQTIVTLKSVATTHPQKAKTDNLGRVQFTNLQPGIYDALVSSYSGDHIINLAGSNHTLILGITLEPHQNILLKNLANPVSLIGMVIVGIILGSGTVAGLLRWRGKKKFL